MTEPDEQKLAADLTAGTRAADALETMGGALDALEAKYFEAWKASDMRDAVGRENLFKAAQIVGHVRRHLKDQVSNGKLAQRQLEDLKKYGKKLFGVV